MNWIYIVTWTLLVVTSVNKHEYDEFGRYRYSYYDSEISYQPKEKYFENRDSAYAFYNRARLQLDIENEKIDSMAVWDGDTNCDSIVMPKFYKSKVRFQYFDNCDTLILTP